jgi:hypothetical protein
MSRPRCPETVTVRGVALRCDREPGHFQHDPYHYDMQQDATWTQHNDTVLVEFRTVGTVA